MSMLDDRDRAILDFERGWQQHVGAKEEAIRAELGLTPTRYYQLLGRVIDNGDALAYDPMLVKQLRRMSNMREAARRSRGIETLR